MAASFLASLLMFTVTGFFVGRSVALTSSTPINVVVLGTIFLNAAYFYLFEAFIEIGVEARERLQKAPRIEWWMRVANQTLLFGLWFALERGGKVGFAAGLVLLYCGYILWDLVTRNHFDHKDLMLLDVAGLFAAIGFLWWAGSMDKAGESADQGLVFFGGLLTFAYAAVAIIGMYRVWRSGALHACLSREARY